MYSAYSCYLLLSTNKILEHMLFCFLSDDIDHGTCFVYEIQRQLTPYLREQLPNVCKINYVTDGCTAQYINYKNCIKVSSLVFHKEDFGIEVDWTLFASSHGKSTCNGIRETVKHLVARASLQGPLSEQISNFESLHELVMETISKITFFCIS